MKKRNCWGVRKTKLSMLGAKLTVALVFSLCVASGVSAEEILFHDFRSGLGPWTVIETGDQEMRFRIIDGTLIVDNTGSGNDQSVIFAIPVDTTGFSEINVRLRVRASNIASPFEAADFMRLQGYSPLPPQQGGQPIIELTTEGQWNESNQPQITPFFSFQTFFGSYSEDNPDLWIALEVNTSNSTERLIFDNFRVTGTRLPECIVDADCDDMNPCNGTETCDPTGVCVNQPVVDCNGNGVPDECDIANETSPDCNGNGIPDDCDIAGTAHAPGVVSWHASSGIPPYDPSIPADRRFATQDTTYISMQDGFLNINETSTTFTMAITKADIDPIEPTDDWAFMIELRTNSHDRPVFDVGPSIGIDEQGGGRVFLLIARDAIGFGDLGGTDAWEDGGVHFMDTTDSFHIYRVTKSDGLVRVYVDDSTVPVVALPHAAFPPTGPTRVWLAQTSNPGVANFDVRRFAYNPTETNVGKSQDCNDNGIPDECDLASNESTDFNLNDIPDECDPDCQPNDIPDFLDIALGLSEDCNLDDVPDDCQLDENDCNSNSVPDECEANSDTDDIIDACDNCVFDSNPDQADFDDDGMGDACDPDMDNDGVPNETDVCPFTEVGAAVDSEGRPLGDIDKDCDTDLDDYGLFQQGFTGPTP